MSEEIRFINEREKEFWTEVFLAFSRAGYPAVKAKVEADDALKALRQRLPL